LIRHFHDEGYHLPNKKQQQQQTNKQKTKTNVFIVISNITALAITDVIIDRYRRQSSQHLKHDLDAKLHPYPSKHVTFIKDKSHG
jgi:hypothetical protein